jgi:hypothetical protein
MTDRHLYERDFYAWAYEQAELLRAGRLSDADVVHIAEEIERMGKTEKRELVGQLTVLLVHLLKWQFHPTCRSASWRVAIQNARDDIADQLADNPSLKPQQHAAVAGAYRRARRQAAAQARIDEARLPPACPWSHEQLADEDFWPSA